MIRLVASDLDGTLLTREGTLPEGTFEMIEGLREKGILFCAASGRQYANMKRLFYPVWKEMAFVCENGCLVRRGGETLHAVLYEKEMAKGIIRDILDAGMQVLLSTPECTFVCPGDKWYTDDIIYRLRNTSAVVDDPFLYADEYIKISGFRAEGVAQIAPPLQEKWGKRVHADVAGRCWLDFTLSAKQDGLAALCEKEGISMSEVMAFGDQHNDLGMLQAAGMPFLMETAPESVKRYGFPLCADVLSTVEKHLL